MQNAVKKKSLQIQSEYPSKLVTVSELELLSHVQINYSGGKAIFNIRKEGEGEKHEVVLLLVELAKPILATLLYSLLQ